jgi:hypothetical protein
VVGLADDREAAALDAVDQPHLPDRLRPVEPLGEDARRERAQLVLAPGGGERSVADVVVEVEVGVVDPDWPALTKRDEAKLLAETRNEVKP